MLTVFVRAAALYALAVLGMRLMGKRQVGQLQPYELVVAIMIADLAAAPMENVGTSLLYGVVPITALVLLHGLFTIVCLKSERMRALISGTPSVLVRRGVVQEKALRRAGYGVSDLFEEIRAKGFRSLLEVESAVLETNGTLSVFPKAQSRPVTPEDLQLQVNDEGLPLTLVLDGRVQAANLARAGLNEKWLLGKLKPLGFSDPAALLLCGLDTQGRLFAQGLGQERMQVAEALAPEEVGW